MNCDVAIGVGWDDPDEEEDHQNEADGEVEAVDQFDLVMPDNYGLGEFPHVSSHCSAVALTKLKSPRIPEHGLPGQNSRSRQSQCC